MLESFIGAVPDIMAITEDMLSALTRSASRLSNLMAGEAPYMRIRPRRLIGATPLFVAVSVHSTRTPARFEAKLRR